MLLSTLVSYSYLPKQRSKMHCSRRRTRRERIGTILLALLAFKASYARLTDDNDLRRLGELINRIPSDGERARIWAELSSVHTRPERVNLCQRLVADHVRPLL